MSGESTSWSLDLDVSDAAGKVQEFKEMVNTIGESEGITNFAANLSEVGIVLGTVGAAFFALKTTMDLVFDAEEIQAVNQQFDVLTKNAGLAGNALKEGLLEASGGLVDETTLLKGANQALVNFNGTSEQFTGLMTVARQATAVFGGDLMTNFSGIAKAVETGNTRMLKHLGIVIDQKAAYKAYADSIGLAVSELGASEKSHAIMNAVLEQSKTAFAGINVNIKESTNAWEAFKATIIDVKDTAILAFDKTVGPSLATFFNSLKGWAGEAKTHLEAAFGDGAEASKAKLVVLEEKLNDLKGTLIDLEQKKLGKVFDPTPGDTISNYQALQRVLAKTEAEFKKAQEDNVKAVGIFAIATVKSEETVAAKTVTISKEALDLRAKNTQKFQADIDKLREASLADEFKTTQSAERLDALAAAQKVALAAKTANELKKLATDMAGHTGQLAAMSALTNAKAAADEEKIDQAVYAKKAEILKKELDNARSRVQVDKIVAEQEKMIAAEGQRLQDAALKKAGGNEKKAAAEKLAIAKDTDAKIRALNDKLDQQEIAADAKYVADADNAAVGIGRSFMTAAEQAKISSKDMADVGASAFGALGNAATAAFAAMGSGAESGAKAMEVAMLHSIGQIAVSKGSMWIATGVADTVSLNPIGPAEIAAGGALVALGSALGAVGSSSSGGGGGGGGSTSSGASTGPNTTGTASSGPSTATANQQQNVNFVVQGNMYNSNEAKAAMMGIMRAATDATGYKYTQVGTSA